jgi:hypothetical protein
VAAPATLSSVLNAAAFGTVSSALSGKIVIESQASGVVTRYQLPVGAGALQPQEVSAMLSRLLDLYDQAIAPSPGGGLPAGVGANDAAILAWMLGQLQVVRSYTVDFSQPFIR